jgi:hypothetical protein
MQKFICLVAMSAAFLTPSAAFAVIVASDNPSGPSTTTHYVGTQAGGFSIAENIAYDPTAGQWIKELENGGGDAFNGSISSGTHVAVDESLTNAGAATWTDWHEAVLSFNNNPSGPGFLIDSETMNVYRNGGLLSPGSDYSIVPVTLINEGTPADWSAVSIFFNPNSSIQPGDTLRISQQIYEVFGDSNVWNLGESAVLGQYPSSVPEPSSFILAAFGMIGLVAWGCRKRRA